MGACSGDTLDDFFPGSGAVQRAWELYAPSPQPGSDDTAVDARQLAA